MPWKCPSNIEYFVFGKGYLYQASVSKLSSRSTRIQFLKNFYTDIINVGGTVKMPRFRSLREVQHVYGDEGKGNESGLGFTNSVVNSPLINKN